MPKITEEIFKAMKKANIDGKNIFEIVVENDKIDKILYNDIFEKY